MDNGTKKEFLILAAIMVLTLFTHLSSAASIQMFSIDAQTYVSAEEIQVAGEISDGDGSGEIKLIIFPDGEDYTDEANQVVTKTGISASNGEFTTTISAPVESGDYSIIAQDVGYGSVSIPIDFTVIGPNDPARIKMVFTEGDILSIPLSNTHSITGTLASQKNGGSFILGETAYYFLVSDDNVAYLDDDDQMDISSDLIGRSVIGNLVEGSKVKLNGNTYKIIFINYSSEIVLAHTVSPNFDVGGETNVTMLVLNAITSPLEATVGLELVEGDGTSVWTSQESTGSDGLDTVSLSLPETAGTYHLMAGDVGHISFLVNSMDMLGDLLSEEQVPQHTFSQGQIMVPVVYLTDITTGTPISDATVNAIIMSRNEETENVELTLSYDTGISAYTASYEIPADAAIDTYSIEYKAVLDTEVQKAYTSYDVKAYDLFFKAVSQNKEETDGFAPGEEGFLLLAGTNLASAEQIDIEAITGLDIARFALRITDTNGDDVTSDWSVMNLSTFFAYKSVPTDIQNEIRMRMGEDLVVLNFTSPEDNGVYDVQVDVNLDQWASVRNSILVQDLFIHGEPVNKMGWFSPKVAPGGTARIMIMAFDPSTGETLAAEDIHEAGLIEVWSDSASDVVTEYMEDQTLEEISVPYMDDVKVLKFTVNDSYLGHHYVKFWVNATVDGVDKKVIGDAWFDEKLYTLRAKPATDNTTGMFRVFNSGDAIELEVSAVDVSSNSVESAAISVESVNYRMNGERIPLSTDATTSYTTDSNGEVTITITPEASLKSGFYNVRLKMTTQDGTTDYGNGWFEVRNFIFFPYSTSWDVGINQPINFSLNAFDGDFSGKDVDVTLVKVISMGDWNMMTPPTIYDNAEVPVGTISGTGYYEYPGLPNSGNYEFVFEATDGTYTETGSAWVHSTAFISWVESNGQYEFPTNGFMNFSVEASEDARWDGTPHSITSVSIEKVMQEGMWMTTYKTKTDMEAITTVNAGESDSMLDVSIDTSGWGQGTYSMVLKVTDEEGSEVYTNFWFQLQLASITTPEPMRKTINGAEYHTAVTTINASTDLMSKTEQIVEGNITAGKISGQVIGDDIIIPIANPSGTDQIVNIWNGTEVPHFYMVAVDTVHRTLYIEYQDLTEPYTQYANLTDPSTTQVFNASIGANFTDYTGRTWEITDISTDGTVELEGLNCLKNGLILNESIMSMSQSGKFLLEIMYDEEWSGIDLDGDEVYSGNERYYLLLVDSAVSGKYDTVLVSDSTDFSAGYIDATAGEPIEFGGEPIYLLANKYQSGAYQLQFTTYKKGWSGMNLGTFASGSTVKLPFLVQTPAGEPIADSVVTIDYLLDESKVQSTLTGINATTDSNGLALISIDLSEVSIPTGDWMIHYNASIDGEYAVADEEMFWQLPRFAIRNFMVSGALGIPGSIDVIKLNDSDGTDGLPENNMLLAYGDELELKKGITCFNAGSIYQLNYPFSKWFYDAGNQTLHYSEDRGQTLLAASTSINSSDSRTVVDYNVTSKHDYGESIVLHSGENVFYEDMWIFDVTEMTGTTSATVLMSYAGWPWTMGDDPWSSPEQAVFSPGDRRWMGGLQFEVESIDESNDTVILSLDSPLIIASVDSLEFLMNGDPSDGEADDLRGSVNEVHFNGQDYLVYCYEDVALTGYDNTEWGGETLDRVIVENVNSREMNIYRLGESVADLSGYYAASASTWGGKLMMLNSSITQVFPLPQWIADEPVFYVGKFSDEEVSVDVATAGMYEMAEELGGDVGSITADERYNILLYDTMPNGINFPTQAVYDDDNDIAEIRDWSDMSSPSYDMYGDESGYADSFVEGMDTPVLVNMSEKTAYEMGNGNLDSWPIAFPTLQIADGSTTGSLRSFVQVFDFNKNESIKIYVTAKDFTGTDVEGNATLTSLKMTFGGSFMEGFAGDLPRTWDMTSAMINTTLVDGVGLLEISPEDLPAEVQVPGTYDFGEYTAFVEVEDTEGRTETLKMNFFLIDEENMPEWGGSKDEDKGSEEEIFGGEIA